MAVLKVQAMAYVTWYHCLSEELIEIRHLISKCSRG